MGALLQAQQLTQKSMLEMMSPFASVVPTTESAEKGEEKWTDAPWER